MCPRSTDMQGRDQPAPSARWAMEGVGKEGERAEPRTWTQRRGPHSLILLSSPSPSRRVFSCPAPPALQDFSPKSSLCPLGPQTPALPSGERLWGQGKVQAEPFGGNPWWVLSPQPTSPQAACGPATVPFIPRWVWPLSSQPTDNNEC